MKDEKIRVLYISDSLKQRFGITAVITNYLNHFDWSRIQVDLLVYDDSESAIVEQYKQLGANVFFMPRLGIKNALQFRNFIDKFFRQHKYKIVHSHFYQVDTIVFPIAKRNGVKKCISHSHATRLSDYKLRAIRNRLMSWNIGNVADVWAACSEDAGRVLFGHSYSNCSKKLLVKNGIECEKFRYSAEKRQIIRRQLGLKDTNIVIGHVGSLKPPKNHAKLIEILSELIKLNSNYKLVLIGDGPLMPVIKAKVQEMALDNYVLFLGTRNDVPDLFNAFDIFVLPSLFEGLGIVAIEAQTNGLECFLSDVVPHEADITSVKYLKIDAPSRVWAEAIAKSLFIRYQDYYKDVVEAGYDINSAALELQSFYENL